jgi:type I site-specific restriction endonuclease
VEDLRKQRYVLLKKNSELKDKNEELALSYDHTKKNNAELRKLNDGLRAKVEELEAAAKSSSRSSSRRSSTSSSSSKDKDAGDKTEVKSEITSPVTPSPTPTMMPAAPEAQAAVDEATAARIAELEKTAGDMLRKNLDMVRKNMDLIKRFKESEANNVALQTALDEANKVPRWCSAAWLSARCVITCRMRCTVPFTRLLWICDALVRASKPR